MAESKSIPLDDKQLEEINILLSDVSLELLGNQFYDIFGQKRTTLEELCQPGIKKRSNYNADASDLMVCLNDIQEAQKLPGGASTSKTHNSASEHHKSHVDKPTTHPLPVPGRVGNKRRTTVASVNSHTSGKHSQGDDDTSNVYNLIDQELQNKFAVSERLKVEYVCKHMLAAQPNTIDMQRIVKEFHDLEKLQLESDKKTFKRIKLMILSDEENYKRNREVIEAMKGDL